MDYTILDSTWHSNFIAFIGVVAVQTFENEWKAYISVVSGLDAKRDEQAVAGIGSPLTPEQAHGYFPQLDITKYKKD